MARSDFDKLKFDRTDESRGCLFPLALIVGGASRYLTGEGDSMLLAWVLCSLFPFFLFPDQTSGHASCSVCAAASGSGGFSMLVPVSFPAGRILCILCALGYLLYSHTLRLKHDELFSNGVHLPAGVGIGGVFSLFCPLPGAQGLG